MMFSVTEHIKAKLTEALEQLSEDSKNTGFLFFSSKDKKQNDPWILAEFKPEGFYFKRWKL